MNVENELELSFYRHVRTLNSKGNVTLVSHVETGEFFVKKTYSNYNTDIYKWIKDNPFSGIPQCIGIYENEDCSELIVIEEFINGKILSDIVENLQEPISYSYVYDIIMQLCKILSFLHSASPPLVHRDIKPSNIIIDTRGKLYLIDFNIARYYKVDCSSDTMVMGTFGYAAPEQFGFTQCTQKTDIYAIGILIKYLFTGNNKSVQLYNGPMYKIVNKATQIDPQNRYTSVDSMAEALYCDRYGHKYNPKETTFNYKKNLSNIVSYIGKYAKHVYVKIGSILFAVFFATFCFITEKDNIENLFSLIIVSTVAGFTIISPLLYYYLVSDKKLFNKMNLAFKAVIHTIAFLAFYFTVMVLSVIIEILVNSLL